MKIKILRFNFIINLNFKLIKFKTNHFSYTDQIVNYFQYFIHKLFKSHFLVLNHLKTNFRGLIEKDFGFVFSLKYFH